MSELFCILDIKINDATTILYKPYLRTVIVTFRKDIFTEIQFIITSKTKQLNYYFKKNYFLQINIYIN